MQSLSIVAIIGRPNVGKSSLFNRLVQNRQAVVAKEAGTTRDPVRNIAEWNGKNFWLIDTAGVQRAHNQLETNVQEQIAEAKQEADVILFVLEAGAIFDDTERYLLRDVQKSGKPLVIALNKIDTTANKIPADVYRFGIDAVFGVSAIHGTGTGDLLDAVTKSLKPKKIAAESAYQTIGLLGRPNVGKSSLFNRLLAKQTAVVSDIPGTTRDVNIQHLNYQQTTYRLLDTAGIRRSGKQAGIERFSILRTLNAINELDVGVLVIDANEAAVALDQKIASLVSEAGKGLIVIINKWDILEDPAKAIINIERLLQNAFRFVYWAPYILCSAKTGRNVTKILEISSAIIKKREQKLKTSPLNTVMQRAIHKHPPAGMKNLHPKLNYATQTDTRPPTFTIFGAHVAYIHPTYKRYLEGQLREHFDLTGTPIRLNFRNKSGKSDTVSTRSQFGSKIAIKKGKN
jgi:GTP-binding protein